MSLSIYDFATPVLARGLTNLSGFLDKALAEGFDEAVLIQARLHDEMRPLAAQVQLASDTAHYAAKAGVSVTKVAIGDARGRWGSCAVDGVIRYSWRLILAPGWVRRATVAHEVAHRVHMNHGPAFHALVAQLYEGDPTPARAWLRAHGAGLHWVGRSS